MTSLFSLTPSSQRPPAKVESYSILLELWLWRSFTSGTRKKAMVSVSVANVEWNVAKCNKCVMFKLRHSFTMLLLPDMHIWRGYVTARHFQTAAVSAIQTKETEAYIAIKIRYLWQVGPLLYIRHYYYNIHPSLRSFGTPKVL